MMIILQLFVDQAVVFVLLDTVQILTGYSLLSDPVRCWSGS